MERIQETEAERMGGSAAFVHSRDTQYRDQIPDDHCRSLSKEDRWGLTSESS